MLPALTPDDLVIAEDRHVEWLRTELHLPVSAILSERPADIAAALTDKTNKKLRTALLREVLEPTIQVELLDARGSEPASPAAVIGTDDAYAWFAGLVPAPHTFSTRTPDELTARSADILVSPAEHVVDAALAKTLAAVRPGGLLTVVFGAANFSGQGPVASQIVEKARSVLDGAMLIDHVWGLHDRPGGLTHGGILGIRPLGNAA